MSNAPNLNFKDFTKFAEYFYKGWRTFDEDRESIEGIIDEFSNIKRTVIIAGPYGSGKTDLVLMIRAYIALTCNKLPFAFEKVKGVISKFGEDVSWIDNFNYHLFVDDIGNLAREQFSVFGNMRNVIEMLADDKENLHKKRKHICFSSNSAALIDKDGAKIYTERTRQVLFGGSIVFEINGGGGAAGLRGSSTRHEQNWLHDPFKPFTWNYSSNEAKEVSKVSTLLLEYYKEARENKKSNRFLMSLGFDLLNRSKEAIEIMGITIDLKIEMTLQSAARIYQQGFVPQSLQDRKDWVEFSKSFDSCDNITEIYKKGKNPFVNDAVAYAKSMTFIHSCKLIDDDVFMGSVLPIFDVEDIPRNRVIEYNSLLKTFKK